MLGAIIGDIVGSRFEFNNTMDFYFDLFTEECDFTDDTICTIAIAEAAITNFDYKSKLLTWCRRFPRPMGGYGASFARWLQSADHSPYNSYGNGAAMRISPVAWRFDTLEDVLHHAELAASVTHNHPEGVRGAQAVAHAIFHLGKRHGKLSDLQNILLHYYPDWDYRTSTVGIFDETCQGIVPLCLFAVLHSKSFEDAIRVAVSAGGDSDTIGAIVGSIAEAYYGIPADFARKAIRYLTDPMQKVVRDFYSHCADIPKPDLTFNRYDNRLE